MWVRAGLRSALTKELCLSRLFCTATKGRTAVRPFAFSCFKCHKTVRYRATLRCNMTLQCNVSTVRFNVQLATFDDLPPLPLASYLSPHPCTRSTSHVTVPGKRITRIRTTSWSAMNGSAPL